MVNKGFTLIELLIVIAILGIVMSVVVPSVGKFGDANLANQAAQNLVSDLELVKTKALSGSYHESNKANWGVNVCDLDPSGASYTLRGYEFTDPPTSFGATYDTQSVNFGAGIFIDCSSSYNGDIIFQRFSSVPVGGSDITIVLNKNSESRTITINGTSGKITLNEP